MFAKAEVTGWTRINAKNACQMLRIIGAVSESAESMNFAKTAQQRAKVIVRTASLANLLKQTLNAH